MSKAEKFSFVAFISSLGLSSRRDRDWSKLGEEVLHHIEVFDLIVNEILFE